MNTALTEAWDLLPTEEARRTHPSVVASNDDELRPGEPARVLERHATGCRPRPSARDRPSVTSHGVGEKLIQ
jgi:hypothetical protein